MERQLRSVATQKDARKPLVEVEVKSDKNGQ